MTDAGLPESTFGLFTLRPERPEDADFLFALSRDHTLPCLVLLEWQRAVAGRIAEDRQVRD